MMINNIHKFISDKIVYLLDTLYYNNVKKLFKNDELNNILINKNILILKPDYFVFMQYYFIYNFFKNITYNNYIKYSFFLHFYYINGCIYERLTNLYNYTPIHNIKYLKQVSEYLFLYLFYLKIIFLDIQIYKKWILLISFTSFYLTLLINELYKARLRSIEMKTDFRHPFKLLIITPNKVVIEKIILKTNICTYNNFLLFINIFLFIFI